MTAAPTGRIVLEELDAAGVERHSDLLHRWVTHPRSVYWQMQDATRDEVAAAYAGIAAHPHHRAWLGRVEGRPAFLAETYDPEHSELAGLPELRTGDLGMHLLVAPPEGSPRSGFTADVMAAVLRHCFADPDVRRVVVEPDVRNERIAALNAAAGFVVARHVPLEGKTAALSFCTRAGFLASPLASPVDHLTPAILERAQRALVAKAIREFSHERLVTPERTEDGWELVSPDGRVRYTFAARRIELDHWVLDPASLRREADGQPAPLDAQELITELADPLGIPEQLLPTYLEEVAATLASTCWKLRHPGPAAADLGHADHQAIEAAMTEGHPAFVANNGRIGFGLDDYTAYAPEASAPVRLVWLACRRSVATLHCGAGIDEEALYGGELDVETRAAFGARLRALDLDPADYLYLPVHPWQWTNKVAITFAPDLARRDLVHLGEGPDHYRPQQSIRTFFDVDHPERHYVKTALAIQNMGFLRGLSPAYMAATPAINDWVADLVRGDGELQETGFGVLRERAAIGYTGDAYHATPAPSAHRKMLAALWRESPVPQLAEGERLMTMAGLLHRDPHGTSLVSELVKASGLAAEEWVRRYLRAYLRPLVHCLVAHDLAFMPHGENLILVLRDHAPVRALMKDIGEEVAVLTDRPLPAEVERIRSVVEPDMAALAIHTDVFDGVLRFLAAILDEDGVLTSRGFWDLVADCVQGWADDHPEHAAAYERLGLRRPSFRHSCLNRLQLRNTLQMVDLASQADSLIFAGELANPIATGEPVPHGD